MFGYGWSSSYGADLVVNADSSVTITEDDGSKVTAQPNGSGGFAVPQWADSTLTESDGTYVFTRTIYLEIHLRFLWGQLTAIGDLSGDVTTLSYSDGKLTAVTDSSAAE